MDNNLHTLLCTVLGFIAGVLFMYAVHIGEFTSNIQLQAKLDSCTTLLYDPHHCISVMPIVEEEEYD